MNRKHLFDPNWVKICKQITRNSKIDNKIFQIIQIETITNKQKGTTNYISLGHSYKLVWSLVHSK